MSMLARATRGLKGLDQAAMSSLMGQNGTVYLPLENRQTWTQEWATPESTALAIATYYACVRVLAESVASLPLFLYRRLPGGGKERAVDHELYPVLHDQPNPDMTSFVWRELAVSHIASWGNTFHERVYTDSGRLQLWPIRPDRVETYWTPAGTKGYRYLSPAGGRKDLDPESIFHVPGLSPDGLRGYSPIAMHRRTLASHNAARDFGEAFFRNGARPATVLSHERNLSTGAIERLAGQMDELRGSRNAGKTVVLEEGMKITEVGIPPEDAQYIQTRVHEAREIQRIFRMPPHMVGDLERSTNNNIEHQGIEFVVYTLRPWLVRIEQEINAQLLADQDEVFAEFMVDGLLRGDAKSRAEALAVRWQHGNLTPDEWRALENENPLPDGIGQRTYVPVNYKPAGSEEEPEAAVPEELTMPPALRVVKSAAVRCVKCSKMVAELATPPYRFTCRHCKAVTEAGADDEPETELSVLKSMAGGMLAALAESNAKPPPEIRQEFHVDARQEPPVVNVTVPPQEAPVVNVNVPKQEQPIVQLPTARGTRKRIQRDAANNIIEIVEEPA